MNKVLGLMDYVTQQGEVGRQRKLANEDRAEDAEEKQLKQLRGAAKYMKQALSTENPAAINGAWQAVRPYLAQTSGGEMPPEQWSPELEQRMEQAIAQTEYLDKSAGDGVGSRVQSTQIDNDGNIWTVDRNGNWKNSGIKASPTGTVIQPPGQTPYTVTTGRGQIGAANPVMPAGAPQPPGAPAPGAPPIGTTGQDPGQVADAVAQQADALFKQLLSANVPSEQAEAIVDQYIQSAAQSTANAQGPSAAAPPAAAPPAATGGFTVPRSLTPYEEEQQKAAGKGSIRPMNPEERKQWNVPEGAGAGINSLTGEPVLPPAVNQTGGNKPLPVKVLQLQLDATEALSNSETLDSKVDTAIQQINNGTLELGLMSSLSNRAKLTFNSDDPKAVAYGDFMSDLEGLRNAILILHKGVQTEGDAKRAMDEIISHPNNEGYVLARLKKLKGLNERAKRLQHRKLEIIEAEYGGKTAASSEDGWSVQEIE